MLLLGLLLDSVLIAGSAGFDFGSTEFVKHRQPELRELHPYMNSLEERIAVKTATSAVAVFLCNELNQHGKKTEAKILKFGFIGLNVGAGLVNLTRLF